MGSNLFVGGGPGCARSGWDCRIRWRGPCSNKAMCLRDQMDRLRGCLLAIPLFGELPGGIGKTTVVFKHRINGEGRVGFASLKGGRSGRKC